MIGDKSKHSIREIQKIGTVKNRPIEVLPYEKEISNDLAVVFKANNYNDREIIVEEEGSVDNRPIGYTPNNVDITNDNIILDFGESAYNIINLNKNIKIQNIINYINNGEYYIILKQDEVGGHLIEFDFDIPLFLSNNKGIGDISTLPNTTSIIKINTIFDNLYGNLEIIDESEYVFNQMTSFEFNIRLTAPNLSFTLPIAEGGANYIHNFTVDWGDTTTNQINSFDSPDTIHTYSTAGDYKIKITGICEYFAFNNLGDKLKMLSLIGFKGDCGFRKLNFYGCTNLTGVMPTSFTYLSNLETAINLFNGCQNLTGSIPENMFWNSKKINDFGYMFISCKNLTGSIPEKLFWYNPDVVDFTGAFAYCINLTGIIPEKIFWYNPKVKSVYYAFGSTSSAGNMKLSGQIPEKLLWNLPELENCSSLFQRCVNLTGSIPENLFLYNENLNNLSNCFYFCIGLTGSIPEKLFWNNRKIITVVACFYTCTGLTGSIPEKLFWNNPEIIEFSFVFSVCTGLTGAIPEKLFWSNVKAVKFDSLFALSNNLTGSIPEKLFYYNPEITTVYYCFGGYNTITMKLSGELPSSLFINNKKISNYSSTFQKCNQLTGRGWEKIINDAEQNAINGGFTISNKRYCFLSCTGLEDYALIPAAWR